MSNLEKIVSAEIEAKKLLENAKNEVEKIKRENTKKITKLKNDAHVKRQKQIKDLNASTIRKQNAIDEKFLQERAELKIKLKNDVSAKQRTIVSKIVKEITTK